MARFSVSTFVLCILTATNYVQSHNSHSHVQDIANWALAEIEDTISSTEKYVDKFHEQAEILIDEANEKSDAFKALLSEKTYPSVMKVFSKNFDDLNNSEECKRKIKVKFIDAVNDVMTKSRKCLDNAVTKEINKFIELASLSIEITSNLTSYKEDLKKCPKLYDGIGDILSALNCLKPIVHKTMLIRKNSFDLRVDFVELSINLSTIPISEGYCVPNVEMLYQRGKWKIDNDKELNACKTY